MKRGGADPEVAVEVLGRLALCRKIAGNQLPIAKNQVESGIARLPDRCYYPAMKTLTMKVPDGLLAWLENEAKRVGQPKSALVRNILQQHQQRRPQSALDLAADLCGCVESGLGDLARNKKHLKGFGR